MAVDIETLEEERRSSPREAPVELPYHRPTIRESLVEAWHSRHLLVPLGGEAIRRTFYLTYLGPLWILVRVGMDIAGKTFLFGAVLAVRTPDGVPYVIFLLSGLLGWTLFQQSLNAGVRSFQRYRRYAARFHLPLILLPIACSAEAVLQFFIYLAIVLAGLGYYALRGVSYWASGPQLLFVPYGLVLCLLFGWGLASILGTFNYRVRDIRHVFRYVIQFWLYVTPVVYPLSNLHGPVLIAAKFNPLAPMLEMIKFGLIGGGNVGVHFVLWGTANAVGAFLLGIAVVNRFGPRVLARPLVSDDEDDDDDDAVT